MTNFDRQRLLDAANLERLRRYKRISKKKWEEASSPPNQKKDKNNRTWYIDATQAAKEADKADKAGKAKKTKEPASTEVASASEAGEAAGEATGTAASTLPTKLDTKQSNSLQRAEAHAAIAEYRSMGGSAAALAGLLADLKMPQLRELADELYPDIGTVKGRKKDDLASKIADACLAVAKGDPQAKQELEKLVEPTSVEVPVASAGADADKAAVLRTVGEFKPEFLHGEGVALPELRSHLPQLTKKQFDSTILSLAETGGFDLHRHVEPALRPAGSKLERDLVQDGQGNHYIVLALREDAGQQIRDMIQGKGQAAFVEPGKPAGPKPAAPSADKDPRQMTDNELEIAYQAALGGDDEATFTALQEEADHREQLRQSDSKQRELNRRQVVTASLNDATVLHGTNRAWPVKITFGELKQLVRQKLGKNFAGVVLKHHAPTQSSRIEVLAIKNGYHGRETVLKAVYPVAEPSVATPSFDTAKPAESQFGGLTATDLIDRTRATIGQLQADRLRSELDKLQQTLALPGEKLETLDQFVSAAHRFGGSVIADTMKTMLDGLIQPLTAAGQGQAREATSTASSQPVSRDQLNAQRRSQGLADIGDDEWYLINSQQRQGQGAASEPPVTAPQPKPGRKLPKEKQPSPTVSGKVGQFGQPGSSHPLTGLSRHDQIDRLAKFVGDDFHRDPLRVHTGPPPGLDMQSFSDDIAGVIAREARKTSVGSSIESVYHAVAPKYGLSKHDFLKAVTAIHDEGSANRISGWPRPLDDIPDPELVTSTGSRIGYYINPKSNDVASIARDAARGDANLAIGKTVLL